MMGKSSAVKGAGKPTCSAATGNDTTNDNAVTPAIRRGRTKETQVMKYRQQHVLNVGIDSDIDGSVCFTERSL